MFQFNIYIFHFVQVKPLEGNLMDSLARFAVSENSRLDALLEGGDYNIAIQMAYSVMALCEDQVSEEQAESVWKPECWKYHGMHCQRHMTARNPLRRREWGIRMI